MNGLKAVLVLCLASFLFISACQGSPCEDAAPTEQHKVSPETHLFLPTHEEPHGRTDYGHDFWYRTLLVVDGCLRLASPQTTVSLTRTYAPRLTSGLHHQHY